MMSCQPEQSAPPSSILQKYRTSGSTRAKEAHAEQPFDASAFAPQLLAVYQPFLSNKLLARTVSWPADAINVPLNVAPAALWHMADAPVSLVRMAYELFYLPSSVAENLLRLALSAANEVLVVDFKCAERNLELPAVVLVNFLPGLRRAGRAAFMKTGGLEGLVFRMGLKIVGRRTLLAGASVMLRLRAN